MKRSYAPVRVLLPFALLAAWSGLLVGCDTRTGETNTSQTSIVTEATDPQFLVDSNGAPALPANFDSSLSGAEPGMTFPVLDALLYDKAFVTDLRKKLLVTDAELQKLKGAAAASAGALHKYGEKTGYFSDARKVAQRSEGQLKTILGPARAYQLQRLVADRYAEGTISGLLPDAPNAVPPDTRVVINAPSHRMDVFKDGSLVRSYLVGIGQQKYPIPTGMRHAEHIIFNPTWTPPNEPWVRGKFAPGKVVAAGSKDNPLGPVKIPIGSPSLIHGGKQPYKLGTYASHGCIGLTNDGIRDFTATLVQAAGEESLTVDSVEAYGKARTKTKWKKLSKPVPVELRYETIVAEDGNLVIYRDVYTRGTNTLAHAQKVLGAYSLRYEDLPPHEQTALYEALEAMNRNAAGKPIAAAVGAKPSGVSGGADTTGSKPAASKGKAAPRQMIVAISGLAGRGYPTATNMVGRTPSKDEISGN